jgi:hypothetical protein
MSREETTLPERYQARLTTDCCRAIAAARGTAARHLVADGHDGDGPEKQRTTLYMTSIGRVRTSLMHELMWFGDHHSRLGLLA